MTKGQRRHGDDFPLIPPEAYDVSLFVGRYRRRSTAIARLCLAAWSAVFVAFLVGGLWARSAGRLDLFAAFVGLMAVDVALTWKPALLALSYVLADPGVSDGPGAQTIASRPVRRGRK